MHDAVMQCDALVIFMRMTKSSKSSSGRIVTPVLLWGRGAGLHAIFVEHAYTGSSTLVQGGYEMAGTHVEWCCASLDYWCDGGFKLLFLENVYTGSCVCAFQLDGSTSPQVNATHIYACEIKWARG